MKKLLIPVILLLVGVGGGVGAAIMLAPAPEDVSDDGEAPADGEADAAAEGDEVTEEGDATEEEAAPEEDAEDDGETKPVEFLNMTNQFIVPLVKEGVVNGLVVVSISLEVTEGTIAAVHQLEPKIRDRFLQVLFNHANNGGFAGNFTDFRYIKSLKDELLRNAQVVAGNAVSDILILDLVRQDPQ